MLLSPLKQPIDHAQNLGSAYYLGANSDRLREIAKSEGDSLRPHDQIPEQEAISKDNWREHLTQKDHTLAYQKFFDNEIEAAGGDWKKVVNEYLYSGDAPLVNGFCGGCKYHTSQLCARPNTISQQWRTHSSISPTHTNTTARKSLPRP